VSIALLEDLEHDFGPRWKGGCRVNPAMWAAVAINQISS
jgi:hypothetical protein